MTAPGRDNCAADGAAAQRDNSPADGLPPEAVAAAVVRLVEALTYQHRVRELHGFDFPSGPDWEAAVDLRTAAAIEVMEAETALTELVGDVDHQVALALIRQMSEAARASVARAEQAYEELPPARPVSAEPPGAGP